MPRRLLKNGDRLSHKSHLVYQDSCARETRLCVPDGVSPTDGYCFAAAQAVEERISYPFEITKCWAVPRAAASHSLGLIRGQRGGFHFSEISPFAHITNSTPWRQEEINLSI